MPCYKVSEENTFQIFFPYKYLKCNRSIQKTVDNSPGHLPTLNGCQLTADDYFSVNV